MKRSDETPFASAETPFAVLHWDHSQLSALYRGHGFPWPEQLRQSIEALLRQAGPVEWVLATETLEGEILRAKAIRPEELAQVTDWGAFLGLTQEVRDANPYLKPND